MAADFPLNPFERSNPLQTFQFLKNEEDTWRAMGTLTAKATVLARQHHTWQLIAIGGADYFEQDNDFVSPPELEYEPNDGQPGTVVLSKSSNRNLNLAVNSNYDLRARVGRRCSPPSRWASSTRTAISTPPGSSRARCLSGQENPDQATSVTTFQDEQLVRDLGSLRPGRAAADGPQAAAHRRRSGRQDQQQRRRPETSSSIPRRRRPTGFIKPFGGVDEIKLRGAFGQTGNQPLFGQKFSPDTTGTIGGLFGVIPGPAGRR